MSWLEKLPNFHQNQLRNVSGFLLPAVLATTGREGWAEGHFVLVPPSAVVVCCLCALRNLCIT